MKSLKSFIILASLFLLSSCETFEIRDYQFYYKFRPELGGGGKKFGILTGNLVEVNQEEIDDIEFISLLMTPKTFQMMSEDLIKGCVMLKKKCTNTVHIVDGIFDNLIKNDNQIKEKIK